MRVNLASPVLCNNELTENKERGLLKKEKKIRNYELTNRLNLMTAASLSPLEVGNMATCCLASGVEVGNCWISSKALIAGDL